MQNSEPHHISPTIHFYPMLRVCSITLIAGIAFGPIGAEAASIGLFHEQGVREFTDQTGRIATTEYRNTPADEVFRHDIEYDSTQPCCVTGTATNVVRTFEDIRINSQFGSTARIRVGDAGAETRFVAAGGQIALGARIQGDPILRFRISKTQLEAAQFTTARLSFSIFVHELADQSRNNYDSIDQILNGPTLREAQYEAVLFGGDRVNPDPSLTITQSGFDTALPEPESFSLGVRNTGWDFGVFEDFLNLEPLGLNTGNSIGISYNWKVDVSSETGGFPGTAFASFFDPFGLEGGLSFDSSNLSELQIAGDITPPSSVPVPAGLWLALTGLGTLLIGKFRRRAVHT